MDIAPTMLSEAQRLHARLGNVEFRLIAGVADLEDKQFDLIWSVPRPPASGERRGH